MRISRKRNQNCFIVPCVRIYVQNDKKGIGQNKNQKKDETKGK